MENLKPVLTYIVNNFNADCAEELYREKAALKMEQVREQMIAINNNQGTIVARARRSKPQYEGNEYCITISENHYHCSCMAYQTSKRDEWNHKKPCKHIIFTACAVAVHMAKGAK